jgi:hypothetical protein
MAEFKTRTIIKSPRIGILSKIFCKGVPFSGNIHNWKRMILSLELKKILFMFMPTANLSLNLVAHKGHYV